MLLYLVVLFLLNQRFVFGTTYQFTFDPQFEYRYNSLTLTDSSACDNKQVNSITLDITFRNSSQEEKSLQLLNFNTDFGICIKGPDFPTNLASDCIYQLGGGSESLATTTYIPWTRDAGVNTPNYGTRLLQTFDLVPQTVLFPMNRVLLGGLYRGNEKWFLSYSGTMNMTCVDPPTLEL